MGYQTDFIGYFQIDPPLTPRESAVINWISNSVFIRKLDHPLGEGKEAEVLTELMSRAPRGWSNWTVCSEGCCLSYDGGDKANHMVGWLDFLMDTFLAPDAVAAGELGMTCDHVLTGMVVGSRRDTRELYAITAQNNEVAVELLWPGNPQWSHYPPLAYQVDIDRFRNWSRGYNAGFRRAELGNDD